MFKFRPAHASCLLGIAGAMLLVTPHSADASTVTTTYTGFVQLGTDPNGFFGTAGADLTGDPFEAVYTIDTTVGNQALSAGNYSTVFGGACCVPVTPVVVSAVLTINGHSFDIGGAWSGAAFASALGYSPFAEITHSSTDFETLTDGRGSYTIVSILDDLATSLTNPLMGWDYRNTFVLPNSDDISSSGFFEFDVTDGGGFGRPITTRLIFTGKFAVVPVGIPEPATWAMLIAGFGALGELMRRRRSAVRPV
jgi:hypothetical protein